MKKNVAIFLTLTVLFVSACSGTSSGSAADSTSPSSAGESVAEMGQESEAETIGDGEAADGGHSAADPVTRETFSMDTYMTLTAYGDGAEQALDEAVGRITELDALLSTGSDSSEVTQLNQNGGGQTSQTVSTLVENSLNMYRMTDGAFDISIYPLMQLWGFTSEDYHVPSEEELADALSKVDGSAIEWDGDNQEVSFADDMAIDFGGIAKGYTSTSVIELLKENGIQSAVINLGGNVHVLGKKPDGSNWRIGIQDPDGDGYIGVYEGHDIAVITSGGYERYFEEEGVTYHHIIDPKTGYPARSGLSSVTIVSEDGTLADGLSTAVFVLGKEEGLALWRAHADEFQMILLDEEGNVTVTQGIADAFSTDLPMEIAE